MKEIAEYFGIDSEIFENYKYIINGTDINFTNADSLEYDPNYFLRVGTKFGLIDKNDKLKLNSHAAQILGNSATKNIIEIETEDELKSYFSGGIIHRPDLGKGQKIVKYNNYFLGTGVAIENQLKSQFPRSKRTGNITI